MSGVVYELDGHLARLTINRPEALNALNREVLVELAAAIERVHQDGPRVVLVSGAGERAFVAGADIAEMAGLSGEQAREFAELGSGVFRDLERLPMPTIAVVNGFALGGGCELALACDLRLASSRARFGQPEVGLGIPPGFGGTQRLARLVGVGPAKELIFCGRPIDAPRALAIGLVNAVFEPDELAGAATALASEIAAKAPIAVRAAKQAIDQGLAVDIDSGLVIEAGLFAACFETDDRVEAMNAFIDKRPPALFQNK